MDALKKSTTTLNIQLAPSSRAPRTRKLSKQFPIVFFQQKLQSARIVAASHMTIWKRGLCLASRSYFTQNNLTSKLPWVTPRVPRCRLVIVMQARGYAAALVEIAQSNEMLETINEDVCKLSHLLQNQGLHEFLVKPSFQAEKKKSILKAVADDAKFQPCTVNFLDSLVDKKRIHIIMDIMEEFDSLYNELTDTQVAVVTSAVKLENHQMAKIARKIQRLSGASKVRIKNVIDPSLIAGFIISYGNVRKKTIDMSVKSKLEKLVAQIDSADRVGACNEKCSMPNASNESCSMPNAINGVLHREESSILSFVGADRRQAYL